MGSYELKIESDCDQIKVIEPKEFQRRYDIDDEWFNATAGGSSEFIINNPQFYIETQKSLTCYVLLTPNNGNVKIDTKIGIYVLRTQ